MRLSHIPELEHGMLTYTFLNKLRYLNCGIVCNVLHLLSCKCAAYPESQEAKNEFHTVIKAYQALTSGLVDSGRYDGRDDFTVVEQPFFTGFNVPRFHNGHVDLSFFSLDCFHFSTKGHGIFNSSKNVGEITSYKLIF